MIGGDDSYKGEDEEEIEFISRWAKRKISSQFGQEFLDGRKSFVFSWDKQHRKIHEKALIHFFDPAKKGLKFKYQPPSKPAKPPPVVTTGPSALPPSSSERRRTDVGVQITKPESRYPPKESKEVHSRDHRAKPESLYPPKESREVHTRDHGARTKENTEGRPNEFPVTGKKRTWCTGHPNAVLANRIIRFIYDGLANKMIRCIYLCSCVFMSRFERDLKGF